VVNRQGVQAPIDFIGIGAQKAGTTSLWAALRQQPWFGAASSKELHYFNFNYHLGEQWYSAQFPPAAARLVRGEVTPDYLPSRVAPLRMSRYSRDLRLIVILRDPVERAFSAFLHARRVGAIPQSRTFATAIAEETSRYGAGWANLVEGGLYYRQLLRYLEHFPLEQMHVVLFEELTDPETGALRAALQFAAGPDVDVTDAQLFHRNPFRPVRMPRVQRLVRRVSGHAQKLGQGTLRRRFERIAFRLLSDPSEDRPRIEPATRAALVERFAPENAALAKLLGRELTQWQ